MVNECLDPHSSEPSIQQLLGSDCSLYNNEKPDSMRGFHIESNCISVSASISRAKLEQNILGHVSELLRHVLRGCFLIM